MSDVPVIAENPEPAVLIETAGGKIPREVSSRLLTHGGITIPHFFSMHVTGACFPVMAGILLYGWRAFLSMAIVVGTAAIAIWIWRRIGSRGEQMHYPHALWMALLLSLTLPPHFLTDTYPLRNGEIIATWPILPAAGMLIAPLVWMLGGLGSGRLHPVIVAHILLLVLFKDVFVPHLALQRYRIFLGDVMDAGNPMRVEPFHGPWIYATPVSGRDATYSEPASQRLNYYTTGLQRPERSYLSLEALLRDRMPPLEDLIIGGHPGPMGTSCAVAVIIGGLFMLYRGVIDYRVPLFIFLAAYAAFLILPVPVVIRETTREWHWLAIHQMGIGPALAVTFANYEILASPLLFVAFFLATSPAVRPLARRARVIYAILVGLLAATFQLYATVAIGPYIALITVSLLTPALDRLFRPRTLV
jgi:Na+-translocating ferredoxin:NAD+ oxidoreductase RnfD subunit